MNATEAIFSHPIGRDNLAATAGKHASPFHLQIIQPRLPVHWKIAFVALKNNRSTSPSHA